VLLTKKSKKIQSKVSNDGGNKENIGTGEVGAKHVDLLYCNKPADILYKTQMRKLEPDKLVKA